MNDVVIILAVLGAGLLTWKEVQRPQRAHLAWRVMAVLLAVAALVCLVLPVRYPVSATNSVSEVVILTRGADKSKASVRPGVPVYTTDASLTGKDITYVPDIPWLMEQHPLVNKITVKGYGLSAYELQWLQARPVEMLYERAVVPEGLIAANWNRKLRLGEVLEVQGIYHNSKADSVKLCLSGLGTRFDSLTIAGDTSQAFSLHCRPAHLGNTLYELQAIGAGRTIAEEKVPVVLSPAAELQVLLLSSSPDFDNRFLANWLYENKYKVMARHTVSKNKYGQAFLNISRPSLPGISTSLLDAYDVVITDDECLAAASASERAALQAAVKKGMGLILQADSTVGLSAFSQMVPIKRQSANAPAARPLKLAGQTALTAPLLPEQWLAVESSRWDQPLVTDPQDAVLVTAHLYGAGKVVVNTVGNTFSWLLAGNRSDYARFWSLLLHKAARSAQQEYLWQQASDFPVTGSPVQLTLQSAPDRIPVIHTPGGKVYVSQHATLPDTWSGTWWPVEKGWQTISSGDSTALYIYEPGDWQAARAWRSINDNRTFAVSRQHTMQPEAATEQKTTKQVPPLVFFGIFLVCCAYLWIEAKQT